MRKKEEVGLSLRTKTQNRVQQRLSSSFLRSLGGLILFSAVLFTASSEEPDCTVSEDLVPFACDGTLFLMQKSPTVYYTLGNDGGLVEFGDATGCPNSDAGLTLNGQGFRSSDGLIYGLKTISNTQIEIYQSGSEGRTKFYATILAPTNYTFIYYIGAIDENSIYYIPGKGPGNQKVVFTLDLNAVDLAIENGTTIPRPTPNSLSSNLPAIHDWAINPLDGKLYSLEQNTGAVITMDLTTTPITLTTYQDQGSGMGAFGAIYFGSDGTLYASQNTDGNYSNIYRVNYDCPGEDCGERVLLGSSEKVSQNDGASCTASLPTLKSSVSSAFALPGDTLTYTFTFSNPTISELDLKTIHLHLDGEMSAAKFVDNSLTNTSAMKNFNNYGGGKNLNINEIAVPEKSGSAAGKATFEVQVVLPGETELYGKTLPTQASFKYGNQTYYSSDLNSPPGSPTPVQVVQPFSITKSIIQGSPAAGNRIQYEASIVNPATGGDYNGAYRIGFTDTLVEGGRILSSPAPEIVSSNPNFIYGQVKITDSTISVAGMRFDAEDEINVRYYVDVDEDLPVGAPIMSRAQALVPQTNIVTAAVENTISLPVEYLFLEVAPKGEGAELFWATATELNNQGFEVQHSTDGKLFEDIGWVAGVGTSQQMQEYQFETPPLNKGNQLFRLKQVDLNGQFSYSKLLEIRIEGELEQNELRFGPNPFTDEAVLMLDLARDQSVEILLYDLSGVLVQRIYQGKVRSDQPQQFMLQGADLAPGYYVIQVRGDGLQLSRKVLRQ